MIKVNSKWLAGIAAIVLGMTSVVSQAEKAIMPFILGSTSANGDVADKVADVKTALQGKGFEIAGDYSPYASAHIIVVTNGDLLKAAASHERAGYVAAQRVSITKVGDQVQISYTNPVYMAAAYQVTTDLSGVASSLKSALGAIKEYGPGEGKTPEQLKSYHYTFGMEYFDEPYELASYGSHKEAVASVEKGLAAGSGDTAKVYRIDIPGTKQTLFGVGMRASEGGNKYMDENFIMTEIDFKETRSTAHLPYEVLVYGGDVEALHARFRIAMNFPDLSMMGANSFMNIMPSPDAIKEALTKAVGGEVDSDF
jgi:hypothetical protein